MSETMIDEQCGCPVRPAPEVRGDDADTLVEHRPDCLLPTPAAPTPTWRDCPGYHTAGLSMATKLRLIAAALDSLGDTELAKTWLNISFQVTGNADPQGRKAAVDALAAALGLDPAKGGRDDQYYTEDASSAVTVYTPRLHQPGCCEHCTIAGS